MDLHVNTPAYKYWFKWLSSTFSELHMPNYVKETLSAKFASLGILSIVYLKLKIDAKPDYLRSEVGISDSDLIDDITTKVLESASTDIPPPAPLPAPTNKSNPQPANNQTSHHCHNQCVGFNSRSTFSSFDDFLKQFRRLNQTQNAALILNNSFHLQHCESGLFMHWDSTRKGTKAPFVGIEGLKAAFNFRRKVSSNAQSFKGGDEVYVYLDHGDWSLYRSKYGGGYCASSVDNQSVFKLHTVGDRELCDGDLILLESMYDENETSRTFGANLTCWDDPKNSWGLPGDHAYCGVNYDAPSSEFYKTVWRVIKRE